MSQSLDDFIATDQFNLEQIRKGLPQFHELMPRVHALYSRSLDLVPAASLPIFGQVLLLCHKAFLCAAATIGRRHPDDAAPITRRAIEAASLAVAVKANPVNFDLWQDYERRLARWTARRTGEKPPRLEPRIKYPRCLDQLRGHLGTISDAYVHFTPEFAAGQEWRRNTKGERLYQELPYITVDSQTIARELFVLGGFHTEIVDLFSQECFDHAFDRDEEWLRLRKDVEACARQIRERPGSFRDIEKTDS